MILVIILVIIFTMLIIFGIYTFRDKYTIGYRLADVVKSLKFRNDEDIKLSLARNPTSIMAKYLSKTNDINNFDILNDIISEESYKKSKQYKFQ